jgi:hypothetical protein
MAMGRLAAIGFIYFGCAVAWSILGGSVVSGTGSSTATCGSRYALLHAGAAQLLFPVLFSDAFFFEGYTGLTVAIGAVVTLFVVMQATASVRWEEVLGRSRHQEGLTRDR